MKMHDAYGKEFDQHHYWTFVYLIGDETAPSSARFKTAMSVHYFLAQRRKLVFKVMCVVHVILKDITL